MLILGGVFAVSSVASAGLLGGGPTWEVGAGLGAAGACGLGRLTELALCSPSDPMVAVTGRRRLLGPLWLGLDVTANAHLPNLDEELSEASAVNAVTPDPFLVRSSVAALLVATPRVAGGERMSWAPLFTFGPGVSAISSLPEPGGPGGTRLVTTGFAGIGLRLDVLDRVGLEAELRHGLALSGLDLATGTVELEPVGSARLSATFGFL